MARPFDGHDPHGRQLDGAKRTWNEAVPARGFQGMHRRDLHINMLEFGAVRLSLLSFVDFRTQPEPIIRLVPDSRLIMHAVDNGSCRSPAVIRELRRLQAVCEALRVMLRSEYLPSTLKLYADGRAQQTERTGRCRTLPCVAWTQLTGRTRTKFCHGRDCQVRALFQQAGIPRLCRRGSAIIGLADREL